MAAENVRNYKVTVPTPGTAARADTSRHVVSSALVQALDANTAKVAVGGIDGAHAALGLQDTVWLSPGDSVPFGSIDLSDLRFDARVAGEGVVILTEE